MEKEDLSLYDSQPPPEPRTSLDHSANSRDSGYGNYTETGRSFESASIESGEDDFFRFFPGVEAPENNLPEDFSNLINGPINFQNRNTENSSITSTASGDLVIKPFFGRALSSPPDTRCCLFREETDPRSSKRPSEALQSPNVRKTIKFFDDEIQKPLLQHHFSTNEANIKSAIQRSFAEPNLIGNFSKPFCLPLIPGRHPDLKSVSAETLAQLVSGELDGFVASYKVIDCRYPYEYEGGHIEGAINLYTEEQSMNFLTSTHSNENDKRANILVFHCEFSSERAPRLCRYLRKQDRLLNQDVYPSLHYPEIYLLDGGYKQFFEHFSNFCVPKAYKKMLDPEHKNDLRYFRSRPKYSNIDKIQKKIVF